MRDKDFPKAQQSYKKLQNMPKPSESESANVSSFPNAIREFRHYVLSEEIQKR